VSRPRPFARDEGGQAVVLFAALALGLISMIGLAIDAGLLYSARRAAQDAADAAAIAGAIVMRQEGDLEDIVAAARDDAARNGYSGSDVTIEYPPLTGAHAGNILYIRVTLATHARGAILPGPREITVSAVGTIDTTAPPPAIWASGGRRKNDPALEAAQGSTISVTGSDVVIASKSKAAAKVDRDSTVTVASPNEILVVGGTSGDGFTPAPQKVGKVEPDPFAGFPKPSVDGLPVQACCDTVLRPGVYPDGLTKLPHGTVTMQPGIYILKGRGLDVGDHTTLTGAGVFIYLTDKDYPFAKKQDKQRQCGDVNISGEIHLTAPTSGPYQGMTLYEDPRCKNMQIELKKSTALDITGAIYLPTAALVVNDTALTLTSAVVVQSITAEHGASVSVQLDPLRAAPPRGDPRLAE